jgi:hypothetical protein
VVGNHQPAIAPVLLVALGHEEGNARARESPDSGERAVRGSVTEVARPAAQEGGDRTDVVGIFPTAEA